MTSLEKCIAQAIVNIFETGTARGDYGRVTLLEGDSGRLTYGRSQTTLASGNLYRLIREYVATPDSRFGGELASYLPALEKKSPGLDHDARLNALLRRAGEDPAMRRIQDAFFDQVYWEPALREAARTGITDPLGVTVVYDSFVHGSWARVRRMTESLFGTIRNTGDQRAWVSHYVSVRREWLSTRQTAILRRTVYRMDAFRQLIRENRWHLQLPLIVRGVLLDYASLDWPPPDDSPPLV